MPSNRFDRAQMRFKPLSERKNKVNIERDNVSPGAEPPALSAGQHAVIGEVASRMKRARASGSARMLVFGAHSIKNGLAPILIHLMEREWVTHLATNGAGIIHDWEIAFQGETSEDVRAYVSRGEFGAWEETGRYLNMAINIGAYEGLGYGEAVGRLIERDGLDIPAQEKLLGIIRDSSIESAERGAQAADLLDTISTFELPPGWLTVAHPFKQYSVQAAASRLEVPLTAHPMIGHDILYEHPLNHCAALGRAAQRDFLSFVDSVSRLNGGVYLSIGSAVMSPMVFEKSLSMARNVALQSDHTIDDFQIVAVDLADSSWDWSTGEPPDDHPDYYLRYNKSFSRMGGALRSLCMDNRDFLLALAHALDSI